ncbi:MAG: amino acid ABC transporter substrate-binding protein [Chloroflexi bacterium]|nr:amino acid ABC transporter substrate-binding protein [Chloroflexota bacterium]
MKTRSVRSALTVVALALLLTLIAGCAAPATIAPTAAPVATSAPAATAAPTSPPAAAAPAEIKVGATIPLTGRYAAGGAQIKNGYELAVEAINKDGGAMVKAFNKKIPLKLEMLDDASDPNQAVQRMETLYNDQKVLAYLGGFGSDMHAAAAAIAEKNKTPYLGVAFALYNIHQKGFKYLFSPFVKSPAIAKDLFKMFDTLNPKPTKYAIFAEKTDWGAELGTLWKTEIQARGAQLVADEQYAPGSTDYTPLITKARDAGAQVLLTLPGPPDGIAIVKQMKELKFNPSVLFAVRAADFPTWNQALSKDGDFVIFAPGWHPAVKFPGAAELNQAHQAKYNGPAQAVTGPAYAAVQILANALGRANSLDRDALREAIAATDMMTVEGPVKFNADGTGQVITIFDQWQAGKQELIWPTDQQTKPIAYPAKPFDQR